MLEDIDWNLVFIGLGALFAALLVIVEAYQAYHKYVVPKKEAKMLFAKEKLVSLKNEYERCVTSIKKNIEENIEKNVNASLKAGLQDSWIVGDAKISEELRRQVQVFNEKCKEYNLFRKLSEPFIMKTIDGEVGRVFPKTLKKSDEVQTMLIYDFLVARYFNGEKVTTNWFRETHPKELKRITKEVDESERGDLDIFFRNLNYEFQKSKVLLRFRKEKRELIKHGKETIKALQRQVESIDKQLEKYSNLPAVRPPSLSPFST